jgi:hypothetical protein
MKTFVRDYLLNVLIATLVLFVGSFGISHVKTLYYTHADVGNFYVRGDLIAEDVCVGNSSHLVMSDREVKGSEIGYSATLIRELVRVENDTFVKVYEESATPFIEKREGAQARVQQLPASLPIGEYRWNLYLTIDVHGVDRPVIPPLTSNVFEVINCE